jgi:hypothetical protein
VLHGLQHADAVEGVIDAGDPTIAGSALRWVRRWISATALRGNAFSMI